MKMLRRIVIILLLCLMGVSAWQLYSMWAEYNRGEKTYDALEEYIKVPEDSDGKKSGEAPFPEVDFAELQKINPDVVGWIYGADTHINYPVVQGKDNNYYLHRMFTGEDNRAGSIFLDSTNNKDFSDVHSILYGHHMKNGAMFHDLMEYKNQEYYDKHPRMYLLTPKGNYSIEFFAGYVAKPKDDAWTFFPEPGELFDEWVKNSIQKSCFESPLVPASEDRVLTLSTCSYEFNDARFVLLGIIKSHK